MFSVTLFPKRLRWLKAIAGLLLVTVSLVLLFPAPAQAKIRTLAEASGQTLFQTRLTLQDQAQHRWQAIAFKRQKADGSETIGLRLVGFPGSTAIDRTQPLKLVNSLGQTLMAQDTSAKIFTDTSSPEPYIGQYDLGTVLGEIQPAVPLELQIPTESGSAVKLLIAPPTLAEWKQLLVIQPES